MMLYKYKSIFKIITGKLLKIPVMMMLQWEIRVLYVKSEIIHKLSIKTTEKYFLVILQYFNTPCTFHI